ncbi:SMAD/FHA domain-containing protein [Xylariaceae sp. FL0804]|nr:SMAD/FHA domain-containing protein [Xylariaceae sp. FL0804]
MDSDSIHPDRRRHVRDEGASHRDRDYGRSGGRRDRSRDRSSDRKRPRRSRSPESSRSYPSAPRDDARGSGGDRGRYGDREREHKRRHSHVPDRDDHHKSSRRRRDRDDEDHRVRGEDSRQIVKRDQPLPSQSDSFALNNGEEPPKPKEKPNYGNTGALAAASNSLAQADGSTIVLKYHEPPEARKPPPKDDWKLFVFKGDEVLATVPLSRRSCWLVGREAAVVDMAAEHPSVSKQHAVIQFRYLEKRNEYGDKIGKVKPYLIDLESANGTMLNNKKVPESRYLELRDKDMVQFGQSTREYVLMLAPRD